MVLVKKLDIILVLITLSILISTAYGYFSSSDEVATLNLTDDYKSPAVPDVVEEIDMIDNTAAEEVVNETGVMNETEPVKVISLTDAQKQSVSGYSMGGGSKARHSSSSSSSSSEGSTGYVAPPAVDPITIPTAQCSIDVHATDIAGLGADGYITKAGDVVSYVIGVTNIGGLNLTGIKVYTSDARVKTTKLSESITEDGIIEPNEVWTYTSDYTTKQSDIDSDMSFLTLNATVSSNELPDASSSAAIPISIVSGYNVSVTSDTTSINGLGQVDYTITAVNTGYTTYTNLPVIAIIQAATNDATQTYENISLGVNETKTVKGMYIITESNLITNGGGRNGMNIIATVGETYGSLLIPFTNHYETFMPVVPDTDPIYAGGNYAGADGHKITMWRNSGAVDPTFDQMVAFIKADKTDEVEYNNSSFVCADFAERVQQNAELVGYKCGWVAIDFNDSVVGHACNIFNTTDRGVVYIDCTNKACSLYGCTIEQKNSDSDKLAQLSVGNLYTVTHLYETPQNAGFTWSATYTVKDFMPYW